IKYYMFLMIKIFCIIIFNIIVGRLSYRLGWHAFNNYAKYFITIFNITGNKWTRLTRLRWNVGQI
ncbi:MAG TPA: hypothetical protein VFY41_08150, partial [Nitrososphaeraceae archaeon]|nr:hypothetical protein [Nitrososphaeraceae archaeon]